MGKRLAPALAALVFLVPVAAHALGLGNMTMNSALNQPLDAEIELLSVQSGDLGNLSIRLGADEDFDRVGVIREFFYTEFKFTVAKKPDGTSYIQITTTKPIVEPFLDFVVEARWARGRILREFTVLVDPPALSAEEPAPIQQAATAPAQAPQVSRQAPVQQSAPQTMQPAMQQPVQPAPIRERAELKPVLNRDGGMNYGPVKYKDTLFDIANKMRPGNVTTNQMMLALARHNPKAFYNGNINQMKAGFVLRIEDTEALTAMSESDANMEVERQHATWIARKSGTIVRQTSEAPASGKVSRGEKSGSKTLAAEQARLKLVAPGSEGVGSGAGDEQLGRMREDLLLAAEALDANKQETDELKTRMAEMEEQLESMQRLIMLKDDEMMAIQKQFGKEQAAAEQIEATPEAVLEETTSDAPGADTEEMAGEGAEGMPAEGEAEAEKKVPATMPAPAKPAPISEPGLLDDPMLMYGGIGLLVLIVGFIVYRKRKSSGGFEESILNAGSGGNVGATAESMEESNESSMVSDFAMSEMSGMSGISADAADVDPVSEADVYLAYGRHQQAEEILNEALATDPNRHDVKLKLLEVFFAAKSSNSFETAAQELHDALGDESDPIWAKAVTMGQQLCPDNSLFGGSADGSPQEDLSGSSDESSAGGDIAEASEDDLLDFDFDIDSDGDGDEGIDDVFAELEAATAGVADAAPESSDADAGLDLDAPITPDETVETTDNSKAEADDDNSLDFDVSGLDFSLDTDSSDDTPAETTEDDNSLDFDMSSSEPAVAEAAAGSDDDLGGLTDDAFGEVDEVGTKLDLAKAYVDMGDSDGARSILDEVLEEGDDAQKAQAKELLDQL